MTLISDPTDARALPPTESTGSKIKKALGPIGVIGVVILKFIGKIKFILPILLKTGGLMVLIVGVYASIWGWIMVAGIVLLFLLDERVDWLSTKKFRLVVSAPIFIPF